MRNAFADQILQLARRDSRVVLLSGDIGNRLFDKLRDEFPDRFYNCGIAEAGMIGMAAGLAMSGLRPYCYTIAPFVTYRCLEQIRVDLCYHHQPVVLVGTGAGLSYASLGGTHHSCEEMGMLRLLPGLSVAAPADNAELRALMNATLSHHGPVYLRIGKKGEPDVHQSLPELALGQSLTLRQGDAVCILCAGTLLPIALDAAARLEETGVSTRVVSFPSIKPLDQAALQGAFETCRLVVTVEEHSRLGGLGGAVAEWSAEHDGPRAKLLRIGTPDEFLHLTCDQDEAREHFGLTPEGMAAQVRAALS